MRKNKNIKENRSLFPCNRQTKIQIDFKEKKKTDRKVPVMSARKKSNFELLK